jgi:hypothetical protein
LQSSNITLQLGLKLGRYGLLAYNLTFGSIQSAEHLGSCRPWNDTFALHAAAIEQASGIT